MRTLERVGIEDVQKGMLTIPDDVTSISDGAFRGIDCDSIKVLKLSKNLKDLQFSDIYKLRNVHTVIIDNKCRTDLTNLKLIPFLANIEVVEGDKRFVVKNSRGLKVRTNRDKGVTFYKNLSEFMFMGDEGGVRYTLDTLQDFYTKQGLKKNTGKFSPDNCINIYKWQKTGKFLPSNTVIYNTPIDKINNYYINNNCVFWGRLVDACGVTPDTIEPFFKCCMALGVFSEYGNIRDKAVSYISQLARDYPIDEWIHQFDRCNTERHGYNPDFAKFYMENCKNPKNFMRDQVSYVSKAYNNFRLIQKAFPHKIIRTNRKADKLTEKNALGVIKEWYDNKSVENLTGIGETLSAFATRYSYSREELAFFEQLYVKAGDVMDDFCFTPKKGAGEYSYELLDKLDPLAIALGDITNCCQKLGDKGQICMEYGITRPNSCFLVFKRNDTIVGQSWVWYDAPTGVVCLDNIEIPERVLSILKKDAGFARGMTESIERACEYVFGDLSQRGYKVDRVTMGMGCNDLSGLMSRYPTDEDLRILSDYKEFANTREAYTDAGKEQRILYKPKKSDDDMEM